ncbi:unnamed protein product, partial [Brassica oleracea]
MRVLVLQCSPINHPFKIPTDPPHPPLRLDDIEIPIYTLITLPLYRKIHTLIMAKTYLPLFESA